MESIKNRHLFLGYFITEYGIPLLTEYKYNDQILTLDMYNNFMKHWVTGMFIEKYLKEN